MSESSHRFFAASAAFRWLECGGSLVVHPRHQKRRETAAGQRGTALHALAEEHLRKGTSPPKTMDPADLHCLESYLAYVRSLPGTKLYEVKADLVPGLLGGTSDCVASDPPVLEVVDLKTGHQFVDPEGNWQLACYGAAVARKFRGVFEFDRVKLTIVQPAHDAINSWTIGPKVLERIGNLLVDRVEAVMSGDAEFSPSVERCVFCPARPSCPAHLGMAQEAARDDFREAGVPKEAEMDELGWPERMRLAQFLRGWIKDVEDEVRERVLRGEEVEGFKAVEGRKGNRSWGDPKLAKRLLESWGFDEAEIYTDPVMRSPAQIEALLKAGTRELGPLGKDELRARKRKLADAVKEGEPGAPTVVPESDSRKPIRKSDLARRDFEGAE